MRLRKRYSMLLMLLAAAVLQLNGLPWVGGSDVDAAGPPAGAPNARAQTFGFDEVEREMILDLVRQYRPGVGDDWRRVLADAVYRESRQAGLDPLMVAAIVAKESSFRSRVVSHAGAVGLMQVRPFVARDVVERTGELEWTGIDTLHDPERNVRVGVLYYQELVDSFDGDHEAALAAYNRGPTRVRRELRAGTYRPGSYPRRVLGLYRELREQRAGASTMGSVG